MLQQFIHSDMSHAGSHYDHQVLSTSSLLLYGLLVPDVQPLKVRLAS